MTTGTSDGSAAQGSNFATSVIQVTNIAPQATRDQMYTFFSFVGQVDDVRLYPSMRDASIAITSRTCFVRFADPASVTITLHLNNTVFIDRAIIITPVLGNKVPEENEGLVMAMQIQQQQQQGGIGISSGGVLGGARGTNNDARILAANPGLISMQPSGKIATPDAALEEAGLPPYPLLPETTPVVKVEEIRRTITVAGLDTTVSAQQCMEFFAENAGEVKYFRYCTRDHDHTKYALIEFSERASVVSALNLNDRQLGTAMIKVIHSTESINKPQAKSNEAAVKEIEEAMSKVTEASHLVSAAVDPLMGMLAGSAVSAGVGMPGAGLAGSGRSSMARSRSRSRRRSRSRDRDYRSRHRSRSRSRRRSKSRDRGSRRDRRRSRSRSKDRKRSSRHRSRSKESRKERKRSRSRDKRRSRRSRSRDRELEVRRSRSKDRRSHRRGSRSKSRERRRRSRSKEKSSSKKSSRHRSKSRDRERSERKRSRSKERSRDSRGNYAKEGRSLRERTPEHKGDARVTRDYDQEEAGFESNGDVKKNNEKQSIQYDYQDKICAPSANLPFLKSTSDDSGFSRNSINYNAYHQNSSNLKLNQDNIKGNAPEPKILSSSQIPDLLSSSNVVGAEMRVGYEGSRGMDITLSNQYNCMKYYNGVGKNMDMENNRVSSRDPRLMKTNIMPAPTKFEDHDHHNYNGKSRDIRLTTVHEDTREAMGTEDMEISNSP